MPRLKRRNKRARKEILGYGLDVPAVDVVEALAKRGIRATVKAVYSARSAARHGTAAPPPPAVKPPDNGSVRRSVADDEESQFAWLIARLGMYRSEELFSATTAKIRNAVGG